MQKKQNIDSMEIQHIIQAYKTLQGKYNAEVPRLHKELKNVKKNNEDLLLKLEMNKANLSKNDIKNSTLKTDVQILSQNKDTEKMNKIQQTASKKEQGDSSNAQKVVETDSINKATLEKTELHDQEGSEKQKLAAFHDDNDNSELVKVEEINSANEDTKSNDVSSKTANAGEEQGNVEEGKNSEVNDDIAKEEFFKEINENISFAPQQSIEKLLNDNDFKKFLIEQDGFTNNSRQETLNDAIEQLNINTVLDICQTYLNKKYQINNLKPINKKMMHTPATNNYSSSIANSQNFSASEFKKVADSFIKGRISLNQFNSYKKHFDINAAKELAR